MVLGVGSWVLGDGVQVDSAVTHYSPLTTHDVRAFSNLIQESSSALSLGAAGAD